MQTSETGGSEGKAGALLFEDARSRLLLAQLEQIAPSEVNVLVTGETGTGKELIARHIHGLSARRDAQFIAVNCGAIPENLIEAELFGHERGAFTGSVGARQGWFEAASGGTLFLDEIGDLPQPMQVKLLRVLQEWEVVRIGARQPIRVDVRLICATNVDLQAAVRAGQFREDLYYRINVANVRLAPLRERPGDIIPLTRHFMDRYARRMARPLPSLAPATMAALLAAPWEGNIRELENVVQYAVLLARDGLIEPSHLRLGTRVETQTGTLPPGDQQPDELARLLAGMMAAEHPSLFATVIATMVRTALERCDGNQVQAARLLGITRNTLRTHMGHMELIPRRQGTGGRVPETYIDDASA